MAHMFLVNYTANHANGTVEMGKAVVVADSHEQASDVVCQQMQLPPSRTRCDSVKVKPPCYALENREIRPDKKPNARAAAPQVNGDVRTRYHLTVVASNVVGHNERQVMRKVGEELVSRAMQAPSRYHLQVAVDCCPSDLPEAGTRQLNSLEKIEMYGRRGGRVSGGQVRGK